MAVGCFDTILTKIEKIIFHLSVVIGAAVEKSDADEPTEDNNDDYGDAEHDKDMMEVEGDTDDVEEVNDPEEEADAEEDAMASPASRRRRRRRRRRLRWTEPIDSSWTPTYESRYIKKK